MVECPTCGKDLPTESGMKSHHARVHGESIAGEESVCEWCGETFRGNAGNVNKFCSRECKDESQTEMTGSDHHNYVEYAEYQCEKCGETFRGKPTNPNRFCSQDCLYDWQSEAFSDDNCWLYGKVGEEHPRYSGGRTGDYPENWDELREVVIERDGGECTACGVGRDELQETEDRDLDVHHIEPVDGFDDSDEAHSIDNLTTMCRSCHRRNEKLV